VLRHHHHHHHHRGDRYPHLRRVESFLLLVKRDKKETKFSIKICADEKEEKVHHLLLLAVSVEAKKTD